MGIEGPILNCGSCLRAGQPSARPGGGQRCRYRDIVDARGGGGAARRLRVGLKAGPETAARLEAGNRGEGLACLFRVCAILPHQACADGSIFFRCQLSKAGLSESTQHIRLILDPSPSPNLRSFN